MLVIRDTQLDALRASALEKFKSDLLDHYQIFAPEIFAVDGEEGFKAFIDLGIEKTEQHGLRLRGPVRLFIDVMCILGRDFDTDPQYRRLWPEDDPAVMPMPFAEHLQANLHDYLEQCVGADKALLADAIEAMIPAPLSLSSGVGDFVFQTLPIVYPTKYAYIGETNLRDFSARCGDEVKAANILSPAGEVLVTILAISFGCGFLENPLYPWVAKRLLSDAPEDERIDKTLSALRVYGTETAKNLRAAA
jgi:hypothetical protein